MGGARLIAAIHFGVVNCCIFMELSKKLYGNRNNGLFWRICQSMGVLKLIGRLDFEMKCGFTNDPLF